MCAVEKLRVVAEGLGLSASGTHAELRQRVEAAGAAARPAMDLERMSAAEFGRLSQEEQARIVDAINHGLDAEDDSSAQGEFDTAKLGQVLADLSTALDER